MRKIIQRPGRLRSFIASTVAACVLVAGWMAVSPELHEHLHHDANDAGHECLVTILSSGGVDHAVDVPVVLVPLENAVARVRPMHPQWVRPQFLNGSVLEHAPPLMA